MKNRTAVQQVYDVLAGGRELTHADLCAVTGLKPPTITTALYQLRLTGELQTETMARTSATGRPGSIYRVAV